MSKKTIFIILTIFIIFMGISLGEGLKIDTPAPFFRVKSGENEKLTLDMIKGKVIVIFYETKDVVEKNRKLKDELNKVYSEQPDDVKEFIVKLPVINCSSAFWPFTRIWKSKLKENSKKEGITIYGDWDGKMKSSYKMKEKESNFVIIDRMGVIRYFACGKIDNKEIPKIKELLRKIASVDYRWVMFKQPFTPTKSNFNFIFKYGVRAKNILNTFEQTFTHDMIVDPPIIINLYLSNEELNKIYQKMVEINFFDYPDKFSVYLPPGEEIGIVTPYSTYYFKVVYNSKVKELWWEDQIFHPKDEKAQKLRELIKLIENIIESKEEYKKLPPPRGGYI